MTKNKNNVTDIESLPQDPETGVRLTGNAANDQVNKLVSMAETILAQFGRKSSLDIADLEASEETREMIKPFIQWTAADSVKVTAIIDELLEAGKMKLAQKVLKTFKGRASLKRKDIEESEKIKSKDLLLGVYDKLSEASGEIDVSSVILAIAYRAAGRPDDEIPSLSTLTALIYTGDESEGEGGDEGEDEGEDDSEDDDDSDSDDSDD